MLAATPSTVPAVGLREGSHTAHAFTDVRIVVSPGQVIEKGTLVIRDGVVVACGESVDPPADARVWKLPGKTIYPAFIDACTELSAEASKLGPSETHGAAYWNTHVVPQTSADARYTLDIETNKKLRSQGIAVRLVAPSVGVIKGTRPSVRWSCSRQLWAPTGPEVGAQSARMVARRVSEVSPSHPRSRFLMLRFPTPGGFCRVGPASLRAPAHHVRRRSRGWAGAR